MLPSETYVVIDSLLMGRFNLLFCQVGSWGGNIAMKSWRKEFPSDTFVALVIANARIVIGKAIRLIIGLVQNFVSPNNGKVAVTIS